MIDTPLTSGLLSPVAELEPTARGVRLHRLPGWVRRQFPDGQVLSMETQPSGVRLSLVTDATTLELVTHPARIAYRDADRPRGAVDVFVDGAFHSRDVLGGGDVVEVDITTGDMSYQQGEDHVTTVPPLPSGEHLVEIWLPHNETIELVALRSDAPIRPGALHRPVWVHHGSSISQGSSADGPSSIWPAVAARLGGVDLHNLGLGGAAMVDPFLARVIRDTPADLISVKIGINVVNADAMRLRAFVPAVHGFLDTIRDGHPDTPLVLASSTYCGIHERTPGPGAFDPASVGTDQVRFLATGDPGDVAQGRLTLEVVRAELAALVERRDDPQLHYLDGTTLYGPADAEELPLPDGLHPVTAAHDRIGRRFAAYAFGAGGPFASAGVTGDG